MTDVIGIIERGPRGPAGVGGNSVVGGVLSGQLPNPSFAVDMATQAELNTEAASRASGDATLTAALTTKADLVTGKVPTSQLPAIAVGGETFIVGSQASQLALDAEIGDIAVRTDESKTYVNNGGTSGTMSDWTQILTPGSDVTAVNGQTGAVVLAASDVGAQPVNATLTALVALTPSNDDVLQRKAGAWVNRTPAQLKADLALAKGDVGLGNVDNTADTAKPVSTAQQTALDLKANSASLGTAAPLNVPSSGDAASGEVVKGSDTRLTNTRTPTDATVSMAKLASGVLDTDGTLAANSDSKLASQKAVKTAIAAEATARQAAMASGTLASRPAAATFGIGYYLATDDNGGTLYYSNASAWTKAAAGATQSGGTLIGYAEITTTSTLTGATEGEGSNPLKTSTPVVVGARPVQIEVSAAYYQFTVTTATYTLYVGTSPTGAGTWTKRLVRYFRAPAANQGHGVNIIEPNIVLAAGSYDFRVTLVASAGETVTLNATASVGVYGPAKLAIVEQ